MLVTEVPVGVVPIISTPEAVLFLLDLMKMKTNSSETAMNKKATYITKGKYNYFVYW
jgi:hypothetical protein